MGCKAVFCPSHPPLPMLQTGWFMFLARRKNGKTWFCIRIRKSDENGEYHTVVVDGPLFRHPVAIENHGLVFLEQITAADLTLAEEATGVAKSHAK